MRFTSQQYDKAIASLSDAKRQLEADGACCAVCGDSGHMAFECGHNPLVAVAMCQRITSDAQQLHDALHVLSGYEFAFGVQLGPARIVEPVDNPV